MTGAFDRALELLDLTLEDPRWQNRLVRDRSRAGVALRGHAARRAWIRDEPRGSGPLLPRLCRGG